MFELCRLCANSKELLIHIFHRDGLGHNISAKIRDYLPINAAENDKLPLQICYPCASALISWHNFYESCTAADKRLRNIFSLRELADDNIRHDVPLLDTKCDIVPTIEDGNSTISKTNTVELFLNGNQNNVEAEKGSGPTSSESDIGMSNGKIESEKRRFCNKETTTGRHTSRSSQKFEKHNRKHDVRKKKFIKNFKVVSNSFTDVDEMMDVDGTANRTRKTNEKSSNFFPCTMCKKICQSKSGLTQHKLTHTMKSEYCEEYLKNEYARHDHINIHHENEIEKSLNPDEVSKTDGTEDHLLNRCEHNENVWRPRPWVASSELTYTCSFCGRTFTRKLRMALHVHKHSANDHCCSMCEKKFLTDTSRQRHMQIVHKHKTGELLIRDEIFSKCSVIVDGQKYLKCDQCGYNCTWEYKIRFLEHYKIHTREKPYLCDYCGRQFRTKPMVSQHIMSVHEKLKKHSCDICGRKFAIKRYMSDHRRIHTGERPYVCDLCGKSFKQNASLFIHRELHKGLRPYKCDLCDAKFTTKSSLTIHVKRHGGIRDCICEICGKGFVDRNCLSGHMTAHTDERPFICRVCGNRYKRSKHLKFHERKHHLPIGQKKRVFWKVSN